MRHIIQKYQEGGVVQPAVNTGIPQGGYAAPAIQNYLSGNSSGNTSGPLSYGVGSGSSGVPDYKSMAAERRRLRKELAATGAPLAAQLEAIKDADTYAATPAPAPVTNTNSTGSDGTTASYVTDIENYGAPGGHWGGADPGPVINVAANITTENPTGATYANPAAAAEYEANLILNSSISDEDFWNTWESGGSSGGMFSGGGSDGAGEYGVVGDIGAGINDLAATVVNNTLIGNGYSYLTGNDLISPYVQPESEIDYSTPAPTYTTPAPTYTTPVVDNNDSDQDDFMASILAPTTSLRPVSRPKPKRYGGSGRNDGGPIGYNTGGISVANTGLREDEIRQRQMMQAQIAPQQEAGPLSGIGEKVAMGAVNNGITNGLGALAAKEGIMGSLGSMLGGSAATGTAATAAAGGSAMMAALGPVGIGLGLGKLFGVFNKGGKVPYPKQKK